MMSGWFTASSSLRAYDQLTPSAMPNPMAAGVDKNVRRRCFKSVRGEAVADAHAEDARVAGGDHVDVGIADDHRFFRTHVGFAKQCFDAERVRLLGVKAVAAVHLKEKFGEAKSLADGA